MRGGDKGKEHSGRGDRDGDGNGREAREAVQWGKAVLRGATYHVTASKG